MSKRNDYNSRRDDYRRDDDYDDDYRKGSSAYRAEDRDRRREDSDEDESRNRDRSPIRSASHDRRELSSSSSQKAPSDRQKLAFGFDPKSNDSKKGGGNIQLKLGTSSKFQKPAPVKKHTVASVFNNSDDDEPEEMPAEAKMRMRNIGRDTPTSAGPNSFGKTKQGFCDSKKIFEKSLKKAMEEADK
ncbi:PEST proteolytic signal-containing nuclear protein isoform X1 [Copidosoma floridanum]|uniref:PEST proteolytic signal-containing nuclear protein isoform X1 n=1 Tax=Copidosoma floridanum TaxID=29053 RepID=UPI0006C94C9D|nr:PEST proteolytic signal-containing nuclear protein isoform X1 [Copidosoma floridanum]